MLSRGQSFDVFQLLISAIVAGAILVILLNIIGIINPPGSNLNSEATALVKTGLTSSYGSPVSKSNLSINNTITLAPTTIAQGTEVSASDICVSAGSFTDDSPSLFAPTTDGRALKYLGSGSKKIGLTVVCGRGSDLRDGLGYISGFEDSWVSSCGGGSWSCTDETSNQTCCVVALTES